MNITVRAVQHSRTNSPRVSLAATAFYNFDTLYPIRFTKHVQYTPQQILNKQATSTFLVSSDTF